MSGGNICCKCVLFIFTAKFSFHYFQHVFFPPIPYIDKWKFGYLIIWLWNLEFSVFRTWFAMWHMGANKKTFVLTVCYISLTKRGFFGKILEIESEVLSWAIKPKVYLNLPTHWDNLYPSQPTYVEIMPFEKKKNKNKRKTIIQIIGNVWGFGIWFCTSKILKFVIS